MSHNASFSLLFRRSSHAGIRAAAETVEADQEMSGRHDQKELFAVAAVAFTMKHEPNFKRHFLKQICEVREIENVDDYEVIVQDGDFADLLIYNEKKSEAIVIEFKIDSTLKPHQNFNDRSGAFVNQNSTPQGYGFQIKNSKYRDCKIVKYAVLLKEKEKDWSDLGLGRKPFPIEGIECYSRVWRDLIYDKNTAEKDLSKDLLNWLAENIPELNNRLYVNMNKLSPSIKDAIEIYSILNGLSASFGLKDFAVDAVTGSFGIHISKKTKSFQCLNKYSENDPIGWFGYDYKIPERRVSVWIYCGSSSKQKSLLQELSTVEGFTQNNLEIKPAEDEKSVIIFPTDDSKVEGDQEWFRSVLEKLQRLR